MGLKKSYSFLVDEKFVRKFEKIRERLKHDYEAETFRWLIEKGDNFLGNGEKVKKDE